MRNKAKPYHAIYGVFVKEAVDHDGKFTHEKSIAYCRTLQRAVLVAIKHRKSFDTLVAVSVDNKKTWRSVPDDHIVIADLLNVVAGNG